MNLNEGLDLLSRRVRVMSDGYLPIGSRETPNITDEIDGLVMNMFWRYRMLPRLRDERRELERIIAWMTSY